jgi:alpha-1,3-mannosylglycoprotein beta-1,4-N-acetylglucosaminyltransferase A/B
MDVNRFFIRRYLFRSGNHEHPSDKFYNTTVEVLPDVLSEESIVWQQFNTTTDGFLIVGSFNGFGVAEGTVDNRIGKLRELRLHVHSESENWVILSEVRVMTNGSENDVR